MKLILASIVLVAGAVSATYHPYYHGLYNHYVAPVPAVPFSGTYSYHDGHRPTVVQVNNGGGGAGHGGVGSVHSIPYAISNPYPWNSWSAWRPAAAIHYAPLPVVKPQKTIVQANLGGGLDPWNYGAFYGTGIYGFGFNNYIPVRLA
ncbi:uncharacterized protein LOC131685901 isoform X2 [Topomyia yanbarensis]|uniref:uncharacterized protein LOC131685901 isoform X2 n=1 Tax=Topomyia yanbarensis TaxID=2498891 RepID=UPI00273C19A7|nr:uncharacterized protein LOC131685901 isoform X2 [Topomyia yanbarensis]